MPGMRSVGTVRGRRAALAASVLASALILAVVPAAASRSPGRAVVHPEVPVTATDLVAREGTTSPAIVVDPTDGRFVVLANRVDGPAFGCQLQVSGDGGRGWVKADPVPRLPRGADRCYAPEVAFDGGGLLYFLFVGLAGSGNSPVGVYLSSSRDKARTFSPPHKVLGRERYMVRMAIDRTAGRRGRIHLVWMEAADDVPTGGLPPPPNPLLASHSDDGGRTFSRPVQVNDPGRPLAVAPALAIGPHHRVHVLYYDLGYDVRDYQGLAGPVFDGAWTLVSATSLDGGGTFGPGVTVDREVAPVDRVMLVYTMPPPSLAVGRGGAVYAAWSDGRNGDADVFVAASPDGGATWRAPRRVNDDKVANGARQYLPAVGAAADGRVDVVFYDRRLDPGDRATDLFYASSTDHGRHFTRNVRVTRTSFDSLVGARYANVSAEGLVEFGGRLGLVSRRSGAMAAWTDTRYTARTSTAQDIFLAQVGIPRPSGPPTGLVCAGLVAALLAAWALMGPSGRRR